jgi:hypothetical protein
MYEHATKEIKKDIVQVRAWNSLDNVDCLPTL